MTPEGIANAVVSVLAAAGTLAGVTSRTRRRRNEIKENLSLAEELQKNTILRDHTPAVAWLNGKIALDVAKLSGQPIGAPKKPIPKGGVTFATTFLLIFGGWTYWLNRDGFVWYSLVTGALAASMLISILGMTTNREIPPDADNALPEGAVPVESGSASDRVVATVAMASMGSDGRFEDDGQVGVALRFFRHMIAGELDEALQLTDPNWILCRIQSWLWNVRDTLGYDTRQLQTIADAMLISRSDHELWPDFESSEVQAFQESWGGIDADQLGGASRRRRVARDYDLVVLAPVGESGGYFVNSPTPVSGGMTFLMHHIEENWFLANHLGTSPPQPGFPPAWWVVGDPSVQDLPD
ncbi:hypothetical protein ACPXCP_26740 [Streptomyces sp. DT20]|uniref:hypothetical protein n=1 Tax=Streptomyces sp. DT20 TaxID=3416519 RepID=UPI003CE8C91E